MFSFLQPKEAKSLVPQSMIKNLYYKYRFQSLIGIFIGYAAYYIVRNNFALSTHFLSDILHMSKTEIGLLSSGMLIAYGLSKGFMSSLADKASPAKFMAFGLICCAIINIFMSFADSLAFFLVLVVLNGFFQGFGVGPSFITLAKWYPKQERGRSYLEYFPQSRWWYRSTNRSRRIIFHYYRSLAIRELWCTSPYCSYHSNCHFFLNQRKP